jgi:hypothetical protein
VEAGATVVQQGDPGDAFYLVVKGAFGVYVAASEGDESRVNSVGPGAPFGEMALLTGRPRSASVERRRPRCSGWSVAASLVHREPQVGLALAGTLCERLRRAHVPGDDAKSNGQRARRQPILGADPVARARTCPRHRIVGGRRYTDLSGRLQILKLGVTSLDETPALPQGTALMLPGSGPNAARRHPTEERLCLGWATKSC